MFLFHKVIVAGGRDFNEYRLLSHHLNIFRRAILANDIADDMEIVCGKAKGADSLGERWGKEHHVSVAEFPADWDRYGRSAGPRRNKQMGDYADTLIAFWDGQSRGTQHMINYSKEIGLNVFVVNY
jgi:hypothetical protein